MPSQKALIAFSWIFVGVPFTYGVVQLLRNVTLLFTG
ncbi:MAG: MFS transporter small subunit [Carbonactinosporaceae bacterium]